MDWVRETGREKGGQLCLTASTVLLDPSLRSHQCRAWSAQRDTLRGEGMRVEVTKS